MKNDTDKQKNKKVDVEVYRFEGKPIKEQEEQLIKTCNCCRFLWNRMLKDRTDFQKIMGEPLFCTPADYKDIEGLEFLKEVDCLALCNVQMNLSKAFVKFYNGETGYPKYKKAGKRKKSYTTNNNNNNIKLQGDMLKLPRIEIPIKLNLHREVKPNGKLKNVTITQEPDDKWYFSILFEYPIKDSEHTKASGYPVVSKEMNHIGLDMSPSFLYMDSNGKRADFEKPYKKIENQMSIERYKLSRMKKNSKHYEEQCRVISKLYVKSKRQRMDMLHKISFQLTKEYDLISIEDLNIPDLKRKSFLSKEYNDIGWGRFVKMLEYKGKRNGCYIVKVDKWFPSSKTCSVCGHVHRGLKLSDRTFICPKCGNTMNRDHQAAINIDKEGLRILLERFAA